MWNSRHSWKNAKSNVIDDMLMVQHHRGPDYKGKWLENDVALGHNRLSIIDLSNSAINHFPTILKDILLFSMEKYTTTLS